MGKAKTKASSSSKASSAATPKCTCDHPFNCDCGNRPPRPSRGHKWYPEEQLWGGKGHKQKGASGQTHSAAEQAKTTDVGKTKIAQWQQMPSTLLKEYCKKEKRRPPKFKNVSKTQGTFLCRLILPDAKDTDKDLFFVPSQPVENEEQAMEEACILALLSQTPNLPHERKLPEPYRTTWLHAIENTNKKEKKPSNDSNNNNNNAKEQSSSNPNKAANNNNNNNNTNTNTTTSGSGGAKASTSLTLSKGYTSNADKRKQMEEARRERARNFRRHEAIRMANQNHPVFLAAHLRQQIQKLLRGDTSDIPDLLAAEDDEESPEADDNDLDENVGQAYALDRLYHEGFTKRQAKTALQSTKKKDTATSSSGNDEGEWDSLYEEALQWLLIHLDEEQLPEGFDPRGGTLDVIAPGKLNASESKNQANSSNNNNNNNNGKKVSKEISDFASKYGISEKEAKHIAENAKRENSTLEDALWHSLQKVAGTSLNASSDEVAMADHDSDVLSEEIEALNAIFPSEFKAENRGKTTLLTLAIADVDTEMTMEVVVENDVYPFGWPSRLLLSGKWPSLSKYGVAIHVETIKFLSTLELGNPMIFEICTHVQTLFHSVASGEIQPLALFPALEQAGEAPSSKSSSTGSKSNPAPNNSQQAQLKPSSQRKVQKRPRERSVFWSTPAKKSPPATAFPKIDRSMDYARKSLPAFKARGEFLATMAKAEQHGRVMLVTGDTGCGKTTQIPQFILEENPLAKIVVAQPRRLAATGVASRVANERGEPQPGRESVGYVVRGDSALCAKSRLVFCTTGVLLRQLQSEGALENISHIIVDEVHERHLDSDILLGFLKVTLKDYPDLRVILMSATLDADKFASYWSPRTPAINIPGRTFPVTDYLLEDVLSLTGYIPPKKKKKKHWQGQNSSGNRKPRKSTPWADSEMSDGERSDDEDDNPATDKNTPAEAPNVRPSLPIEELLARVDETDLDYDMLAHLVRHLVTTKRAGDDGSILVFLSGAPEINNAMETIKHVAKNLPVHILPLHGGLQPKDQRLVFEPSRNGITKVILSTNVAESSITVPDCTVVIDSCREKQSSYDPSNRMPLLLEQFASKASCKQRRGRAGRVQEGVCYKLISQRTYNGLKDFSDPEICRCALDQSLLSLMFLGVENGSGSFMRQLMDPPPQESIAAAILSLRQLGAAEVAGGPGEFALTPLGMHLAGIPAPPSVGKLLIMGCLLGCRTAALAMAAGMTMGRIPFLRIDPPRNNGRGDREGGQSIEDMKKERVVKDRKTLLEKVGHSDHALLAAIYLQWEQTNAGGGGRKQLCDSLGLSFTGMRDMMQLVNQYDSSLRNAGYFASQEADRNIRSWKIIRACIVAALAPSQLVRIHRGATKYDKTVEGAVERDGAAKELKFFVRTSKDGQQQVSTQNSKTDERVFIHPSSFNFSVGNYSCPWLVYHSLVRTSKPFLRDVTECSAYSLLLFGGDLEVQANEGVIVIDQWVKLDAKARIGSLIGGLRNRVDDLLAKKIQTPSIELANTSEMKIIVNLIVSDGHG